MTPSALFPMINGWTMKWFFLLLADQFKILKISLNFHEKNTPTTQPKVANFFIEIKHNFCKHNAKQSFQASSSRTAWKRSRPEENG
jgi:hypothetical protein